MSAPRSPAEPLAHPPARLATDPLDWLTPGGLQLAAGQRDVVRAPAGPVLVLAGAGSGKTATMAARVAAAVATGVVAPNEILGLTFSVKAAAELAARIWATLQALPSGWAGPADRLDEPTVLTYHAYAARLVAENAPRLGREPTERIIGPAEAWQLAARAVAAYDGPMPDVALAAPTVTAAVLSLDAELREHDRQREDLAEHLTRLVSSATQVPDNARGNRPAELVRVLACQRARLQMLPIVERYRQAKRERGVLDYTDLMALATTLAEGHPQVVASERAAYRFVLLDEYQDTSVTQARLMGALFGDGHPLTAVGDPCQTIYGWRGASAGNMTDFSRRFSGASPLAYHPDGSAPQDSAPQDSAPQVLALTVSFRNPAPVLAVANAISAPLRSQALRVPELQAAPPTVGQEAPPGDSVRVALLASDRAEADWVAGHLATMISEGTDPGQVAVLVRRRSQVALLRGALVDRGVPVCVVGIGGLLGVPEVAEVLATLEVLADPTAGASLLRLLTGPRWRIGPRDLVALAGRARELAHSAPAGRSGPASGGRQSHVGPSPEPEALGRGLLDASEPGSLVEALDDLGAASGYSAEGYARMRALADELRRLRSRAHAPLPDLIADVVATTGLDIELAVGAADPLRGPAGSYRGDLDAFTALADAFTGLDGQPALPGFLAYCRAGNAHEFGLERPAVEASGAVSILTVHAAKGREWDVVAVPGLAAGARSSVFPARPLSTPAWTTDVTRLPFELRGDRGDLPELTSLAPREITAFHARCREHQLTEERRLAYVAVTRARRVLLCSGYVWGRGSQPLGPSVFLHEARAAAEAVLGPACVEGWEDRAGDVAGRSADQEAGPDAVEPAAWPVASAPDQAIRSGARIVNAAIDRGAALAPSREGRWAREAAVLLAERTGSSTGPQAVLPAELSATTLVELERDPARVWRSWALPTPRRPDPGARIGTAFHAWVAGELGRRQPNLLDPDELPPWGPGSQADPVSPRLAVLQEAFRRSPWWGRPAMEVEVGFQLVLAGVVVRGRIDAVYSARSAGLEMPGSIAYVVVDWKTGAEPRGAEARAAVVQLGVYRLAWAELAGLPVEAVSGCFHYVDTGRTHWPTALPARAALEALLTRPTTARPAG